MKNLLKSKKGFTLVELIVVIVIIAILAAALVTSLIGYINKAGNTTALVEANNVYVASQSYISETIGTGKSVDMQTAEGKTDLLDLTGNKNDALFTAVNEYLGSDVAAKAKADDKGAITEIKINANGTIEGFTYTASNNRNVTFTSGSTGWVVSK